MTESDQLSALLSAWAAQQRLTADQVSALRDRVLASTPDAARTVDADWLWSLLKPVTRLMDCLDDLPIHHAATEAPEWTTYLQLAPG
jgi:hypothetical protein